MGKFIATKFSDHQQRVVKRPGKSMVRCNVEKQPLKPKKVRREPQIKTGGPSAQILERPVDGFGEIEDPNSDYRDLKIEVTTNPNSGNKCLKLVNPDGDLFADDELKARYDQYTKYNLIFIIFDEIALDGLEGITIEAYWKRLQSRLNLEIFPDNLKEFIWQVVCSNQKIKFFELPEAREDLIIVSLNSNENNMFDNPIRDRTATNIYKVEPAPKNGADWGSCSSLNTRVDISEVVRNMYLDQAVTVYGNKLVLLADEDLRKNALFDDLMDPNYEFTQTEYCVLEQIGRARMEGISTLGPMSLTATCGLDPRSTYHYCNRFRKECLIARQYCVSSSNIEQGKAGRLLHLRRFYQKKKSKYMIMVENIIAYLKKCPEYRAPYASVKMLFRNNLPRRFFKHQEFLKYIDTSLLIPFKEYYREATYRQYMTKSLVKERVIQLIRLKDPCVNVAACWTDGQTADSSDDEEDGDIDISRGRRIYNKDFIRDVYQYILSKGLEGIKGTDLNNVFDIDFPTMRCILKKLTISKLIESRKCDIGKQTVNQYVATCVIRNPGYQISRPKPIEVEPSSVLERLKQRQRRKIDSVARERVYTAEEFEAGRERKLLSIDARPLLSVTFQIPQIACKYFVGRFKTPEYIGEEADVFLVQLKEAAPPFNIKLTYPKFVHGVKLTISISPEDADDEIEEKFKSNPGELDASLFKPDHFAKTVLMRALLDNLKPNSREVIDFLDPSGSVRPAAKRPLEVKPPKREHVNVDDETPNFGMYMGSQPSLVLTEKDEESGFVMKIYISNPIGDYKTGDITNYEYDPALVTTDRVLSRIAFILRTIQRLQVMEEMNKLLKLIYEEETKAGYDKRIDRKSLHRIYKRLTDEGYIKIISVIVSKDEYKKTQTYVCHPQISLDYHVIQECLALLKEKTYCYGNNIDDASKPVAKKEPLIPDKSPFIEEDVVQSIIEIKQLSTTDALAKSSKKSGKYYGRRSKFATLALMHELLFYLIYQLEKDTQPLAKTEVAQMFQKHKIKLTQNDLKNLPPVYSCEISWKTFIPPLPYHHGWNEGWALLIDILLRFPITLITRCYSVNFISTELQEVLQHPIKRFYLLRDLSPNIRMIVMHRRKFIHDMYNQLVLLSYCGLCQFGPSSFHNKEKSFFYLNRKAAMLDTTLSSPGYLFVEDKEYPKINFCFNDIKDVFKYWTTMNKICLNTNLSARRKVEGKTITLVDSSAKPSLNHARAIKTPNSVKTFDNGDIPGDWRGAAGLDSSLCSHIHRNWYFFATKKELTFAGSLDTLKPGEITNKQVSFDRLRLPMTATAKYYLAKPLDPKKHPVTFRKVQPSKTGRSKPVIKRTIPIRKRKLPSEKKTSGLDAVDKMAMRKSNCLLRYRPNWTTEEIRLLMLLKIASSFITPGTTKQIISYSTFRDVMHILNPKCRDKTTRSISNRLKVLQKNVPILSNIESLIPNLYKLVPIAKYFVPFRKFVLYGTPSSGTTRRFKFSDYELNNAFLFLVHYFVTHRREVETSLHGRNATLDYFHGENLNFFRSVVQPFETKEVFYSEPESGSDIRKYALKNTIQSGLSHKCGKPEWSLQMYKIYQKFSEDVLKKVLREMRDQRLIQSKKDPARTFFTPYRLSTTYIFAQTCSFWYATMEEAYQTFLDLKYYSDEMDFSYEGMVKKKYGQMLGMNEVLSFMPDNTTIEFKFPEHHLILNPKVEDHSEVIEELAKRYQAKLKNNQKAAELHAALQTAKADDEDDPEMCESEPGPSTTTEPEVSEFEIIPFDDDEPLDLSITGKKIDSLKHWISDCIDSERVRSPSPKLLNLQISREPNDDEAAKSENKPAPATVKEESMLTLEQIKEEMLKPSDGIENRLVPYISDLTKLFSENFEEIESEERAYYLMKKHFVQQYPSVKKVTVDGLSSHYLSEFLEERASIKDIWIRAEREAHVEVPSDKSVAFDDILQKGGTFEDVNLAHDMMSYIKHKGIHGAAGYELKDKFLSYQRICSLELILKVLINHHLILRTGVCTVKFVHHIYQNPWLTDTFTLSAEQVDKLPKSKSEQENLEQLQSNLQKMDITKWIKLNALPWITVDGTLNTDLFKMWLSQVFSYCIENPKCTLTALYDKFCYLKPVDVFYLIEMLEEIGAVEIRLLPTSDINIFSEYEYTNDCKASFLDKFEEIYVEPNNICFITLGSFFHSL